MQIECSIKVTVISVRLLPFLVYPPDITIVLREEEEKTFIVKSDNDPGH
jgi:hypothetical protein